jgi:hypothetical protein
MEPSLGGSFDALLGIERTTSELIESHGSDVTRCHKAFIDSIDYSISCFPGFKMLNQTLERTGDATIGYPNDEQH